LNETTPDVIVSDVSLANLSGLEAAKIIKEQHSQVKIVILTAELCINKYHAANKIGVDGYILKNEIENITYIINNILRGMTYISSYFQERTRDN
jgi:DNA-binding NarL/FixJ family response regulator